MEARPTPTRPLFLTPREAAPLLGMSEDLVREAIRRGELPGRKVLGRYKIARAALDDYCREMAATAPAPQPRRPWS